MDLADRGGRQVRQELGEVMLRVDPVPTAGAGHRAEDRGGHAMIVCLFANDSTVLTTAATSVE